MSENYKGYNVCACWSGESMGFYFVVYSPSGEIASEGDEVYWYEKNAIAAGRDFVDSISYENS